MIMNRTFTPASATPAPVATEDLAPISAGAIASPANNSILAPTLTSLPPNIAIVAILIGF